MLLNRAHYIFILLLFAGLTAAAQQRTPSNLKKKKIAASGTVMLDSLSIVPESVTIPGVSPGFYVIDPVNAILTWKQTPGADSVWISYRCFPFRFNQEVYRFNADSLSRSGVFTPYIPERTDKGKQQNVFDFGGVNYSGSFGRSLTFGNNQDAVFNSQLNLQMNGYIADSIEIVAAITDNNIPIQPDGTTQQLNEFDKILLQFRKKNWEVSLGDIDLRQQQSYFLNFYKRLQGISYRQQTPSGKKGSNTLVMSGAIAKGKFTRNIFQGQEGNQGPYRLQGANNEFFFIILAGTERVFIDGELMQRGEDQDYVINYNTAEITFTPKRMITKDRRIQVEFEYADRNYLNSMVYVSDEMVVNKRLKFFAGVYSNGDAKNSPINQSLDAKQKQFLSNLGDSTQLAFYPVASLDSFSASKILYAQQDTVYGAVKETIYIYSTDPAKAHFSLNFIDVGFGKGNYVPLFNAANGKVYQWVQPVNGVRQGNYEPAVFLVAPKKQVVLNAGMTMQLNAKTSVTAEAAMSNYDVNTFSSKDKTDNKGFAAKLMVDRVDRWHGGKKVWQLASKAGYEFVQARFKPIERLRPVEFGRDWGLGYNYNAADEHLPSLSFTLSDDRNNQLQYSFNSYLRGDHFSGYRHQFAQLNRWDGWQLSSQVNFTNYQSQNEKGSFFRPTIELSKRIMQWHQYVIGGSYSLEDNRQKNIVYDSLNAASFSFDVISAYLRSDPAKDNRWSFTYTTRRDKLPFQKSLQQADQSHNYALSMELLGNRKHQLRSTVTYRQLQVSRGFASNALAPDNSLLGRVEYNVNEWDGLLSGSVLYELGAGQEQKRDFSYVEVPAGRGEYAWNDYNNDGIPQLNEFEIALFSDQAKYIRIYTPTNEFIKANYTQFNYTFNLDPRAISARIHNQRWKKFITRWNLQSALQTGSKLLSNGEPSLNPFHFDVAEQDLVTLGYSFANTISLNRFSSSWGLDLTNLVNVNKALLTYGVESRKVNEWVLKGRWSMGRNYLLELVQRFGSNDLFTPKFSNRNYQLDVWSFEPRISYTELTSYRLQASYQLSKKQNALIYGGEESTSHVFTADARYNAVQNTSINARFSYNSIGYTGQRNTTISYIMMDGLLPGNNLLWTVDLTKRFANNLELSLQYEGRKPADTHVINIGRASIRAIL